jgi:hypothetical protein
MVALEETPLAADRPSALCVINRNGGAGAFLPEVSPSEHALL